MAPSPAASPTPRPGTDARFDARASDLPSAACRSDGLLGLVIGVYRLAAGLRRPRCELPRSLAGTRLQGAPADCLPATASPRFVRRGPAWSGPGTGNGRVRVARCRHGALASTGAGGGGGAWPTARDRDARQPVDRRGSRRRPRTRRAGGWLKTGTYVRDPRGPLGRNGRALARPRSGRTSGLVERSITPVNGRDRGGTRPAAKLSAGGSDAWARTAPARHRRAARSR